ncbi:MAG: DUF4249 domain-containing protein [Pedobacter sp.]|nr:DUF4249 domain-containing protein [Pedobacter sp.]
MKQLWKIFVCLYCVYFTACKEPYQPQVTTVNANILVVEGFISTNTDSTVMTLSRTVLLNDKNTTKPELNASVWVENDANASYPLKDLGKGLYGANGLNLDPTKKHRIKIKTVKGSTYVSDFVETKISPPIDDINFDVRDDGIQLYVNTHDDTQKSRYYRWEYYETWEFNSKYSSLLKVVGNQLVERQFPADDIYTCYASSKSTNVFLNSTVRLDKDVVYKGSLNFIPKGSEKISNRFTTLVTQYVLTKEAYEFWEKMKKNTESLGSIFDAQPSQLTGNIHNVDNAEEPVIGFISAGTMVKRRVFFERSVLPNWLTIYPYGCAIDTVKDDATRQGLFNGSITPIDIVKSDKGSYPRASTPQCVDCTIRGSHKKPSFW